MIRYVILFCLCTQGFLLSAQDPNQVLTKRLGNCEGDDCVAKISRTYDYALKSKKTDKTALQFWTFYVYDSLSLDQQADSICRILLKDKNHGKILGAHRLYVMVGNQQMDSSNFEGAITFFYKALKLTQTQKLRREEGQVQRLIGLGYLKLDKQKEAENHLRTSLTIAQEVNNDLDKANAAISLGNSLKDQNKVKESVRYYELSLKLALKINNERLVAGNYNNLGNAYRRLKKLKEAIVYFNKALEMNEKTGNKLWISFNYHNLGMTYTDLKQYDKAIRFHQLSNEIKRAIGDSLSMVSGYEGLSNAYAAKGDYKHAYNYLKLHIRLKDTLNLIEQANALSVLETKYETEKKEARIKQLQTENELRHIRNEKLTEDAAKTRNYFLLSGLALIFLAIGFVFVLRSNRIRKKVNELLQEKNVEIQQSHEALQQAMEELSIKNKEIIDSINYATYIQEASLPNMSYKIDDKLRYELFFAPKDIVSGDFYFSYQQYNRSVFGVGDCTGHGVPGAMVSLIGMNSMDKVVREERHNDSASIVESFNEHVLLSLHRGDAMINDGMDLSLCLFDHVSREIQFTGANHNALIIRQKRTHKLLSSEVKIENESVAIGWLPGARRPIGRTLSKENFYVSSEALEPSDRVVLFSDGYADQTGGEIRKKLKRANMMQLLLDSAHLPIGEQMNFMKQAFTDWKADMEQVDDVCLMIVEIC